MQTDTILSAPLIDIIFDGRNKEYGAYELRRTYEKRIRKALLITILITALMIGSMVMAGSLKKQVHNPVTDRGVKLTEIDEMKKPEKLPKPEKPKAPEPQVQTERFNMPEVKPDNEVESTPPSQTELENAKIDIDPKEGTVDEQTVDPGPENIEGGDKGIVQDKTTNETGPREHVDIDARFDGNWKRFLETHLIPEVPAHNGAPAGRYSVVIRFVVDVDGTISEITPLTAHGFGLEEEAIRVIKKSKKWEPAFLNGIHVKAYKKQVIVFDVMEE
jgi:protein TonB